jgi:hypothetical protein
MRLVPRDAGLRHVLAAAVAWWAMTTLVRYRVLEWPVAAYLPYLGTTIIVWEVAMLAQRFLAPSPSDGPLQTVVTHVDRAARLVVVVFAYWAILVASNAVLDRAPGRLHQAEIVGVGGRTASAGVPIVYSWARIRWQPDERARVDTLVLGPTEQRTFWVGERILLGLRPGRFGIAWVGRLERDPEVYAREAVALTPEARLPWKDLIEFLVMCARWDEVAREGRRYLAAHPDDADFAYYAGENLSIGGLDAEARWFLERAVALDPSRYKSFRLAWFLTRQGDATPAIATIGAAATRHPTAWEFPFLLGYHYAKGGRYVEAMTALRRVEALKPGVPEVGPLLERLDVKLASAPTGAEAMRSAAPRPDAGTHR